MARLLLEHVSHLYANGIRAVDDLSLEVADGELLVLVGPSGCGKTTTLRLIAGLEEVSQGTISIGDRVVNRLAPKDRDVAMVFQNGALYPHMSVYRNVAFSLRLRKVPKAATGERVAEAAGLLGIEHLLNRKPQGLSGGEAQRVALARAIVRRPACFLLDEPLAHLDAPLRLEMRAELRRLHHRLGTTIIYVTHDQEEAMTLGRRVAVVRQGRVQQVGDPLDVYRRPANRFVAGFLGSPPMNFLEGTILEESGRLWFDEGADRLPLPDWAARPLAGQLRKKVVLGIRPENIELRRPADPSDNALRATVDFIEPLGDRLHVYVTTERHRRLVARGDCRDRSERGAAVLLHFDPNAMHFFAADDPPGSGTGINLCPAVRGNRDELQ